MEGQNYSALGTETGDRRPPLLKSSGFSVVGSQQAAQHGAMVQGL